MVATMKSWGLAPGTLAVLSVTACAVDDPLVRVGACVAASSGGQLAGPDSECELGRRTYLVVLPRNTTASDMRELGLSKEIVFALNEASSLTGPRWCSVTTNAGGLPTHGVTGAVRVECIESSVEIDSPAVREADAVRIRMERRPGERLRVTSVEAVPRQ
jgi:hypothetical protein